jgi:hypothetical protein
VKTPGARGSQPSFLLSPVAPSHLPRIPHTIAVANPLRAIAPLLFFGKLWDRDFGLCKRPVIVEVDVNLTTYLEPAVSLVLLVPTVSIGERVVRPRNVISFLRSLFFRLLQFLGADFLFVSSRLCSQHSAENRNSSFRKKSTERPLLGRRVSETQ